MGRRDLEHHDEATLHLTDVDFGDNRDLASEEGDPGTGRPNRNQTTEGIATGSWPQMSPRMN